MFSPSIVDNVKSGASPHSILLSSTQPLRIVKVKKINKIEFFNILI